MILAAPLATNGMVHELLALLVEGPLKLPMLRNLLVQPCVRRFHGAGVAVLTLLETSNPVISKEDFSKEIEEVFATDLKRS